MNYNFLSATILLIFITDPFGNIPIFANALKNVPQKRRPWVILREVLIAFALLLLSQAPERRREWIAALSVTMLVCALVLVLAERIQRVLGERFIVAVERLMGLILVAVAVEMLLRGFKTFAGQMGQN